MIISIHLIIFIDSEEFHRSCILKYQVAPGQENVFSTDECIYQFHLLSRCFIRYSYDPFYVLFLSLSASRYNYLSFSFLFSFSLELSFSFFLFLFLPLTLILSLYSISSFQFVTCTYFVMPQKSKYISMRRHEFKSS